MATATALAGAAGRRWFGGPVRRMRAFVIALLLMLLLRLLLLLLLLPLAMLLRARAVPTRPPASFRMTFLFLLLPSPQIAPVDRIAMAGRLLWQYH